MSEAVSPNSDAQTSEQADQADESMVEIHLSGPAEFSRSISDNHDVTATHERAFVDGTVTVDKQMLFEVAPPTAHLTADFVLRKLFGHDEIMTGYRPVLTDDDWDVEFQADVETWKAITNNITDELGYRTSDSDEDQAQRYLSKLEQESLLGESGLLAILELAQLEDVGFNDRRREEILDALAEVHTDD